MVESNPPLLHDYSQILRGSNQHFASVQRNPNVNNENQECELPLVDLRGLRSEDEEERACCVDKIARASSEWGFFQVVNHGVSLNLLDKMRSEQIKLFNAPFESKASCGLLNNSYRWGTPTATCPGQFSWSEAFHIPLTKISEEECYGEFTSLREVVVEYAGAMQELAKILAGVLVMNLGHKKDHLEEICDENTCFMRLNHYPACPISPELFGLVPHTDSDFITILHQDEQVSGLQLMKDGKWVSVKPNKEALVVNIGDLFQAWSNDVYKSVKHRVMVNSRKERFSVAYFLCPSYDSIIGSCKQPSLYKNFTFREYRNKTQQDLKLFGYKIGLPSFLFCEGYNRLSTTTSDAQ